MISFLLLREPETKFLQSKASIMLVSTLCAIKKIMPRLTMLLELLESKISQSLVVASLAWKSPPLLKPHSKKRMSQLCYQKRHLSRMFSARKSHQSSKLWQRRTELNFSQMPRLNKLKEKELSKVLLYKETKFQLMS